MFELPSFRELDVFRTTLATGSATAAAQRLGISQPSVSRALAQIEERMGMMLFIRQNGRLSPTAEAMALNAELDAVFDSLDRVRGFAETAEAMRGGRLRVMAPPSFCTHFVTPMVIAFKRAHPTIRIELRTVSSQEAQHVIAAGEGDIAVTTNRITHPGVRMESILKTVSVCVIPPDHSLARKKSVHATDLEGEDFIALSSNHRARRGVDRLFERAGVTRNIILEANTNLTACEMAAAGLGITVVNPFPVLQHLKDEVVIRPFTPLFHHTIFAMLPNETAPNWLGRAFLSYLKRSAAAHKTAA